MTEVKFKSQWTWLNIQECESIYERFRKFLQLQTSEVEPLPPFTSRYQGTLESILGSVRNRSEMLSYDCIQTAVCYYVLIAQGQAFFNGNKRMSVILMGTFLLNNGYVFTEEISSDLTLLVAEDKVSTVDELIEVLTIHFKAILAPAPQT